jgi:glutamyl-tRNA synthetase
MEISELGEMVRAELENENLWDEAYDNDKKDWYLSTLDLIRDRFHTLTDFASLGRAYFADDFKVEEKPLKKNVLKHEGLIEWLPILADRYEQLEQFNLEETEHVVREYADELEIKPGILINGMRTVVTGQLAGPSMFDILVSIGQERVVSRLRDVAKLYPE